MKQKRIRAWNRWLICKRAIDWMRCASGSLGDWYWAPLEDYSELRRRGFVDEAGRVTPKGHNAMGATA